MRKFAIHSLITVMFLSLSLLPGICPASWQTLLSYAAIPVVFVVLDGILCGAVYGGVLGFLMPVFSKLLFAGTPFLPDVVLRMLVLMTMGIAAGLLYGYTYQLFWTLLGTGLSGFTSFGFFGLLLHWILGKSFSVADYLNATVFTIWPGILLTILIAWLLISVLRKNGAMSVLRDERMKRKQHVVG